MKLIFRSTLAFLVLLVLGILPAQAKGRRPPDISFTLDPSTVTAGRTLTVWCKADVPLSHGAVYFKERKALFYPVAEKEWRALLGVPSMEEPGPKDARVYAKLPKGKIFQTTVTFQVAGGTYPVSRVGLTKEKDTLITSGKLEQDAKVLDSVYREPAGKEKLWSGFFVLPTTGVFSSPYGARRAYTYRTTYSAHTGTDIANEAGTPISAPNRGQVVFADWLDSFGNSVVLDHGLGIYSYYLHMKESLVKKGDLLETGAPIGLMGAEGLATGPHLHWSFVVSGERVDPLEWTEREFK